MAFSERACSFVYLFLRSLFFSAPGVALVTRGWHNNELRKRRMTTKDEDAYKIHRRPAGEHEHSAVLQLLLLLLLFAG